MRALPFRLLLITDEAACARAGRSVLATVAQALPPSAPDIAVLLRAKATPAADLAEQARALRALTRERGALLLLHGEEELAAAVGADGLHLADGVATASWPGLVGGSRHAGAALGDDDTRGLAYVTLAPIFRPSSKPEDTRPPLGLAGLERHARGSSVPVVALGGVDASRARPCLEAGAAAVAVLGGVMAAPAPGREVAGLLAALGCSGSRGD